MKRLGQWIQILGFTLILASLALLAGSRFHEAKAQEDCADVSARMEKILAVRTPGAESGAGAMPVLELSGRDYVCMMEVPGFGVSLPVCDDWSDRSEVANPCRYWGSCYDGSLIIGGGRMAQLEFCAQLDLGDRIVVTDMRGQEFTYFVTGISRTESLTFDRLREGEHPLSIFTRDGYSNRYILVRCGYSQ